MFGLGLVVVEQGIGFMENFPKSLFTHVGFFVRGIRVYAPLFGLVGMLALACILWTKILTLALCTGRSEKMVFVYFYMFHVVRHTKERSLLKFYSKKFCSKT